MTREIRSRSPDGSFAVEVCAWEARMSHTVETPALIDRRTGRALLSFVDSNWSLDASTWIDDHRVRLVLRRYPGDHDPARLEAEVDCRAGTARVGAGNVARLDELESVLRAALRRRGAGA